MIRHLRSTIALALIAMVLVSCGAPAGDDAEPGPATEPAQNPTELRQ